MSSFIEDGARFRLTDPTLAPNSAGYLWNRKMMLQMNCRGYAVSQYMDPEPRKYAHVPTLAAVTFMQPEQGYFAHHPGRFFYLRDNATGALMSAPYEPVRAKWDSFAFEPGLNDIRWVLEKNGLRIELCLDIPIDDVIEIWSVRLTNRGDTARAISFVPYFPVGYASWMNQGGHFDAALNAVVATSVTPYQKVADHFKNRHLKDLTFFAASRAPEYFEVAQQAFEGEGGLHNPSALQDGGHLNGGDALYEMAAGIMQWDLSILPGGSEDFRFVFGPAHDKAEIAGLLATYLTGDLAPVREAYAGYIASGRGALTIDSPDESFNHFVNNWLPRQVFYHGDSNRLSTDPQTRNYLQDALGMLYIAPERTREAILRAASQQFASGKMPDGILLSDEAELKYINQVPHSDHAVWLVIVLDAYLAETGDRAILAEKIAWCDSAEPATLFDHLGKAVAYLADPGRRARIALYRPGRLVRPDEHGRLQGQGRFGLAGRGDELRHDAYGPASVTAQANPAWRPTCAGRPRRSTPWSMPTSGMAPGTDAASTMTACCSAVSADKSKGASSSMPRAGPCCRAQPTPKGAANMLAEIEAQLDTPYGTAMLAPAYTAMREDVGRVTQKWPGSAENGAVYNHAAIFYAAALFHCRETDRAFSVLDRMLTRSDARRTCGCVARFRSISRTIIAAAYYQFPRTAGRSSNLFNTGTVAWYYRLVIEQNVRRARSW